MEWPSTLHRFEGRFAHMELAPSFFGGTSPSTRNSICLRPDLTRYPFKEIVINAKSAYRHVQLRAFREK